MVKEYSGQYKRTKYQNKQRRRMWGYLRPSEIPLLDKYLDKKSRDRVIFRLMYRMGLRVGEVVGEIYEYDVLEIKNDKPTGKKIHAKSTLPGIWTNDINFDTKSLTVKGKGDVIRIVPIPQDVWEDILKYLEIRNWNGKDNIQLIVRYKDNNKMTTSNVRDLWQKIKRKVGLRNDIRVHDLRHTAAMEFLRAGGDVRDLKEILGHSDLKITYLYTEKLQQESNIDSRKIMEKTGQIIKESKKEEK